MLYLFILRLLSLLMDIIAILGMVNTDKDLEILLLRQQIRILQRKSKTKPVISNPERLILSLITNKLRHTTNNSQERIKQAMLIFSPETILKWHRELAKRKWTFKKKARIGRPRISPALETLIIQMAHENRRWGYLRIQGELLKLGSSVSFSIRATRSGWESLRS